MNTIINPDRTDCHGGNCKAVHIFDEHHVVHRAEGGTNIAANLDTICPNEHRNQHELDDLYDKHQGAPPWAVRRSFARTVQARAKRRWAVLHP